MANKPTQPLFPLGLETAESSVFKGFTNSGTIEHSADAIMTLPEGDVTQGIPSSVRYNHTTDAFEGYYDNGGWLPLGGGGIRWEALGHAPSSNLVEGRGYLVDNKPGASTVVLPTPTKIGDSVSICDAYGKFSVYPLTISGNGHPVYGAVDDMAVSTDNMAATFTWSGDERGWVITAGVGLGQGRVYNRTIYTQVLAAETAKVTLSEAPSIVDVYADGKRLLETKYALNGNDVEFTPPLASGVELQIIEYIPIQLGVGGGGGTGSTAITWIYNGGAATGGETTIVLDVVVDSVAEIYIRGVRQQLNLGFTYDKLSKTITLADELEQGDEVIAILNGTPAIYNQIDRTPQEVARSTNLKDDQVILSTSTAVVLDGKQVIYDVSAQKYWRLPTGIPAAATIVKVVGNKLTYNPGNVTVDLLPNPGSQDIIDIVNSVAKVFSNVAALKAYAVVPGLLYQTQGYYTPGDRGGAFYIVTEPTSTAPDGYADHVASNGKHIYLNEVPTDLNHGVKTGLAYVPAEARQNRNAIQSMLRNTRWDYCESIAKGTVWFLGASNVGRSDLYWHIQKGCSIRGRYSDPSIPTPDQAGGMLNFADYFDADNGDFIPWRPGDMRVNGPVRNIHIRLDGDVATEYNDVHINKYNNNCISFARAVDCSVRGTGGVSESDHRGINFDGYSGFANPLQNNGNVNCHIDVSYINSVVDNPAMMVGDKTNPSTCTVRVASIRNMRAGGYNNPIVVNVADGKDFEVWIGRFNADSGVNPSLVTARNCGSVKIHGGFIRGCNNVVYTVGSLDHEITIDNLSLTPQFIYRGEAAAGSSSASRNFIVRDIKQTDTTLASIFANGSTVSPNLGTVEISGCNFLTVAANFKFIVGNTINPVRKIIRDNMMAAVGDNTQLNYLAGGQKLVTFADQLQTKTIDFKDGNWNFTKLTIMAAQGGGRGMATIDIAAKQVTSTDAVVKAGDYNITISLPPGSSVITATVAAPTYIAYFVLHN